MRYDLKKSRDNTCRRLQHIRRETQDIHGKMVLRLPERRDIYIEEEENPLKTYLSTKKMNKEFFSQDHDKKIDITKFGRGNYLTAPKNSVGVASHKNYFVSNSREMIHGGNKSTRNLSEERQFMNRRND